MTVGGVQNNSYDYSSCYTNSGKVNTKEGVFTEQVNNIASENDETVLMDLQEEEEDKTVSSSNSGVPYWAQNCSNRVENVTYIGVTSIIQTGLNFEYNYSTGVLQCIDINKGGKELWSKEMSEEDYEKCGALFDHYPGESTWEYKYAAYLEHEGFWDMFLNDEIDLKTLKTADNFFADDKFFAKLLRGCTDSVRDAWKKALMEAGNVFARNDNGDSKYFSELHKQLIQHIKNNSSYNILGKTDEDAVNFAKSAIESLKNRGNYNSKTQSLIDKEIKFYEAFLANMDK